MDPTPIIFNFATLEAVLASIHDIDPTKRMAFQARLKNYHRQGYPINFESSKGRAALYTPGQAVEMALALEVTQLGLNPERLARVLTLNRFPIYSVIRMAAADLARRPEGFDTEDQLTPARASIFLFFDPAVLSPLMVEDAEQQDFDVTDYSLFYGRADAIRDRLAIGTSGSISRLALVNITSMIDRLAYMAAGIVRRSDAEALAFKEAFFAEVYEWADRNYEATYPQNADWFVMRLIDQALAYLAGDDAIEVTAAKLIAESGLKPKTVMQGIERYTRGEPFAFGKEDDDGDR
jgi:hypothetical protein